ncbi:MAG: hypothetical protein V1722_03920 [Candidatus Micrarchaeota archaeon]
MSFKETLKFYKFANKQRDEFYRKGPQRGLLNHGNQETGDVIK